MYNSVKNDKYRNICRTCLSQCSAMKCIFDLEQIMESQITLCEMLMTCASVVVKREDGLPEYICRSCFEKINNAYTFRVLCERSDATLRKCVNVLATVTSVQQGEDSLEESFTNTNKCKQKSTINVEDQLISGISSIQQQCENVYIEGTEAVQNAPIENKYFCERCARLFENAISYEKHVNEIHNEIFECVDCNKKFETKDSISCHTCFKDELATRNMRKKRNIVTKRNLPRTCYICNKTFRFHSNLERHKLIHTGERPYLCYICGRGFAQMSYLKIHSFTHTGEKPYKCQLCEKSFSAPGTLMTHVRTHTGERPHSCKICGKAFPQSGYLAAHIRTHTGEKPLQCQVCHQRFNQSGPLIVHMRMHSGEKPFQCKDCGKSFAVKGTLKKHTRTHTGERPYVCQICDCTFAQSGTLANHMKAHNRSKT